MRDDENEASAELFHKLYDSWCHRSVKKNSVTNTGISTLFTLNSPVATVSLCFLCGYYQHAGRLVKHMTAEGEVTPMHHGYCCSCSSCKI